MLFCSIGANLKQTHSDSYFDNPDIVVNNLRNIIQNALIEFDVFITDIDLHQADTRNYRIWQVLSSLVNVFIFPFSRLYEHWRVDQYIVCQTDNTFLGVIRTERKWVFSFSPSTFCPRQTFPKQISDLLGCFRLSSSISSSLGVL